MRLRPLSLSQMRMLARLLAGPRAFASRRSVNPLIRKGMLEQLDDGRVALSRWGKLRALQVRSHPQVAGWAGGIMGSN